MLIDFHSHTRLSDGEYDLTEWAALAADRGYAVLGVTDHVTRHALEERIGALVDQAAALAGDPRLPRVIPGCEVTRVPPEEMDEVVRRARAAGARLVLVHGETPLDLPVPGTNRAAIEAGVDILAHPGLIERADVVRARERGVLLEISGRKIHSLANGHVLGLARAAGARVVIDSDSHTAADLFTERRRWTVGRGAGMTEEEYATAAANAVRLAERLLGELVPR